MNEPIVASREKWYADGLRFECTQCGNCCSGPPGFVWVTREESRRIAEYIKSADKTLGPEHKRRVGLRHSLTEKPDGDCIFLKREGGKTRCGIYPVRPLQCRTWPFWSENLRSADAWQDTARRCPGMNSGKHYGFVAIEEVRRRKAW